ncbi:MAG: DUF2809 domain-containing protein [Clostridiales bacterium]|nr:DUF2809 domain-containing protein [Clostridiales bacterium]
MKSKLIKINIKYLCAFIISLAIEAIIAAFVHDQFIRPYVGDMIVVILMYFSIKIFLWKEIKLLPLYIFFFSVFIEALQLFRLPEHLGFSGNRIAMIILGSVFDIKDIACYFAGCLGIFIFEILRDRAMDSTPQS